MTEPRKYPLNGSHLTAADDIEMLRCQDDWPSWPLLPLKRDADGGGREFGTVTATTPLRVYAVGANVGIDGDTPRIDYESPDAIVADGWKVD